MISIIVRLEFVTTKRLLRVMMVWGIVNFLSDQVTEKHSISDLQVDGYLSILFSIRQSASINLKKKSPASVS